MGARRKVKVTNQGQVEFYEDIANGQNMVAMKAPAALASNVTLTLPNSAGLSGYLLKTDGGGNLDYQDPAGISGIKPLDYYQLVTGVWYMVGDAAPSATIASAAATLLADNLRAMPFAAMQAMSFDRIQIFVDTAGGANSKARVGVYAPISASNPRPGALLADLGEISTAATGFIPLTINFSVGTPQLLQFAIVLTGGGGATGVLGGEVLNNNLYGFVGSTRSDLPTTHCTAAFSYAALPSTFPGVTLNSAAVVPRLMLRRSA